MCGYTDKMERKTDHSFGVVPLYKDEETNEVEVLLVYQKSYVGDQFWILPKGHKEAGEAPAQAALRELEEETGLIDVKLDAAYTYSIQYSFMHEGVQIDKTVTYFLGWVTDKATNLTQPEEIAELRWCSLGEAVELATHKNTKNILEKVTAELT